jgi:cytochrome P450
MLDSNRAFRPPAPTPHPKLLGPFALLRTLRNNPLEAWAQVHFEKLIVPGGLPIGQVILVNEPDAIRHVLLDNAVNYEKDWLQRRVLSAGLSNGLLTVEKEQWRVQRRTLLPMFVRKTVTSFAVDMVRAADELVTRWRNRGDSCTLDVAAEVRSLALDVLTRTIFSDGLGRHPEEFRVAMAHFYDTIGKIEPFDVLGVPDFVPRPGRIRARPVLRFFHDAIDTLIATRWRQVAEEPARVPRDLLTLLLEAQDPETDRRLCEAEVRANIITFIAAGHETTANAIAWSLFLLSQSEEWREQVAAEAERELAGPIEGLAERLTKTRAVIDEAIRLYPPIPVISRAALAADEIGGHRIRRRTMVVVAPYVLHRHRMLWEEPDLFDPTRFLPGARTRIDRFAYLPFGVGPRVCIGSAFALQEATIVLASIMSNFELKLAPNQAVWPMLRVTLRPAGGLQMVVRPRRPGACSAGGLSGTCRRMNLMPCT